MELSEVRKLLKSAGAERKKTAMFHYIFLKHAHDFINFKPDEICAELGVSLKYSAEIRKMRAVYILMKEKNLKF